MSTLKVGTIQDHANSNTALTIASDGTLLAAQNKIVHWKIVPNGSDNHASGSWTQVNTDHAIHDSHSLHSGNNIVITSATAGLYHLTGHIRTNNRECNRLIVGIYSGGTGTTVLGQTENVGSNRTGVYQCAEVNFLYRASSGDSLGLYVYHDYGSAIGILGSTSGHETWFSGYRISA